MSKHRGVLSYTLVSMLTVVFATMVRAQLPNCRLGCVSTTCGLTKEDGDNKRYCVKWERSQAGQAYSYGADPNAHPEVVRVNGQPVHVAFRRSNETCSPDCDGGLPSSPGTSADCGRADLSWTLPDGSPELFTCVRDDF